VFAAAAAALSLSLVLLLFERKRARAFLSFKSEIHHRLSVVWII
jgi:hypothetical protein